MRIDPDRISLYFSSGFWGNVVNRIVSRLVVRELEQEILKPSLFCAAFRLGRQRQFYLA